MNHELSNRFAQANEDALQLSSMFNYLTSAHIYFQGPGKIKAISVSDPLDDGSIEASFHGVRIKFSLLLTFNEDNEAVGRVIVAHCHCIYGTSVQAYLGAFSLTKDGFTDIETDAEGRPARIDRSSPNIVLTFLASAMKANKLL